MDGVNIPTSIDVFGAILLPVLVATLASIVGRVLDGKLSALKGFIIIAEIIGGTLFLVLSWYNLIGYVYYYRGVQAEAKSGCPTAVSYYERAVLWNPKIIAARTSLVECKKALNHPEDLIEILEPLERQLFTSANYWKDMALVYFYVSEFQKMRYAVNRAADLDPADLKWAVDLGEVLHRAEKYSEAEFVLRVVRYRDSRDALAVFWLSWSLYEQGKFQDALYHFGECIRLNDNYFQGRCYAGKGFTLIQMGRLNEAKEAFQISLQIAPNQDDVEQALSILR